MEEILHHLGCIKNPQLVHDFSHQQYIYIIYIYICMYVMLDPLVDMHISQAAHGRYGLSLGGCQTSCLETSAPKGAERGGWVGLEIIYTLPKKIKFGNLKIVFQNSKKASQVPFFDVFF